VFFNTFDYAVFLPVVLGLYWWIPRGARIPLLLVASYVFYGWWDARFLALIAISTLVDFMVARRLAVAESPRGRRRLLSISIVANLGFLGFFKYWGFFIDSAAELMSRLGLEAHPPVLRILLPAGISFYTFQALSYTIDVYRRRIEPEPSLLRFALFISFFPHLVAGPIMRASQLLAQFRNLPDHPRQVRWKDGVALIGLGLFRKVVFADGVAPFVDRVFSNPSLFDRSTLFFAALGFAIQIYGDFAGYSDIARGTARLFGVELVENFRQPYLATSVTDFWRRWHMSLSTWLREYLYISLGGNRHGRLRTFRNLMLTMLLGGLWHGANWTFVLWGGLHGLYLSAERLLRVDHPGPRWPVFGRVWTFGLVGVASFADAADYLGGLIAGSGTETAVGGPLLVVMLGGLMILLDVIQAANPFEELVASLHPALRGAAYGAAAVAMVVLSSSVSIPFIYFRF